MRPIKLVLTAFGPYASTQVVDFREATDAGLFGIYGPTGSGKSSIFSALTFALFGEPAKKEQPMSSLRSGHAPADLMTEVSLVFELGSKRYLVRRQPDQVRPKTRGEGETAHSHSAWLFDVTDIEVDGVDVEGAGRLLAEKKVSQVAEQIKELLGYGADQFRQIVLLPQGRFERFLTSDSNERLKILRDLFDVSLYRTITDRLRDEAADARRQVSDGYRIHGQRLATEGFASSDELEAGIVASNEEVEALAAAASYTETARSLADEALTTAEALDRRFQEAEQARRHLASLRDRTDEIAAIRIRRDQALLARQAIDFHAAIGVAEDVHLEAIRAEQQAATDAHKAADNFIAADLNWRDGKAREHEIEASQRRSDDLTRYHQALQGSRDLKATAEGAARGLISAEEAAREAADFADQVIEREKAAATEFAAAQRDDGARLRLLGERGEAQTRLERAKTYARTAKEAEDSARDLNDAEQAAIDAAKLHDTAKARLAQFEAQFIAAQSTLLATRLVDGEGCPVCGAIDHPSPADGEGDPHALEKNWKDAQAELASFAQADQTAAVVRASSFSIAEERRAQLERLGAPDGVVVELETDLAAIERSLADLGSVIDLAVEEKKLEQLRSQLVLAREAAANLERVHQEARRTEAVARRAYEDQLAGVPEPLRDEAALSAALAELTLNIAARKEALSTSQAKLQEATADKAAAEAGHLGSQSNTLRQSQIAARAHEQFEERLSAIGISEEQFSIYHEEIAHLPELTKIVEQHEAAVLQAEGAAAQSAVAIADLERPDLEALRAARDTARQTAQLAAQAVAEATAKYEARVRLQRELAAEIDRLRILEETTGPLRALAEAFSGQNEMNTALESFAIGAMFDQVLAAANLRLEPMTSGRYRLERDVETTSGRAKRGLDILVHDIETGRPRDLSTLSGGETFIAALSLALGLSDIVEATHGSIRLDTIFVDEGFGSLDTDNDGGTLDLVLQVLQDIVGKSRAVGLISHVPMVQQAVPNGFTISKGIAGSSIEKRAA